MRRFILVAFSLSCCFLCGSFESLQAASPSNNRSQVHEDNAASIDKRANERYDIMRRDEIDNTDTFAIPFDDSEIEDEEEIDRLERKDVFPLPHSPR